MILFSEAVLLICFEQALLLETLGKKMKED